MGLRRRRRYAALCHIARHQFYLALEWIAPAAAASRDHAHHLPRQHGLAIDEAAEVARGAFEIEDRKSVV